MKKFYMFIKILLFIILSIVICIPFMFILIYLSKQNKKVVIYPKFKVVDIENDINFNEDASNDAVRIGKEILQKIKS